MQSFSLIAPISLSFVILAQVVTLKESQEDEGVEVKWSEWQISTDIDDTFNLLNIGRQTNNYEFFYVRRLLLSLEA